MQTIIQFFQSDSVLALAVSFTIFLITVILVAKRFIGFMVTLLLLAFSIAAGYAVFNHDIVRKYFIDQPQTPDGKPVEKPSFPDQLQKAYEEIKRQLSQEKESLESVSQSINQLFQQLEGQRKRFQSLMEDKKETPLLSDTDEEGWEEPAIRNPSSPQEWQGQ